MKTVLVVDDRPDARYSMTRPLAAAGFDIREASSGFDALEQARLAPDAIVLDIRLPDINGLAVLRRLKSHPATKDIPVIVKTAHRETTYEEQALQAGATAYFAETFDPRAFLAVVRRVLGDEGASSGWPSTA